MLIVYSILLSIAAVCYTDILTADNMILHKPYLWLEKHLPEWLFYPVIYCSKCVSGQWALWLYIFYFCHGNYDIVVHLWFILQCIFNSAIIHELYVRLTNAPREKQRNISLPPELQNLNNQKKQST